MNLLTVLFNENRRIYINGLFLLLTMFLVMANLVMLYLHVQNDDISAKDYKRLYTELQNQSMEEQYAYLENIGDTEGEYGATMYMLEQLDSLLDYNSMLNAIKENASLQTSISIFQDKESYSYKNIEKTVEDYEGLIQDGRFRITGGYGLSVLLALPVTDICVIIFLFMLVFRLVMLDKQNGCMNLYRVSKNGRTALLFSKYVSLITGVILSVVLFWGSSVLYISDAYGRTDWSAPIQTMDGYLESALHITIGQYLLSFVLLKLLLYMVLASVLFFLYLVFSHYIYAFGAYIFILLLFAAGYYGIPQYSVLAFFKYMNPVYLLQTSRLFSEYRNIRFLNQPVSQLPLAIGSMLCFILLITLCSIVVFRYQNQEYKALHLFSSGRAERHTCTSVFLYECYKFFIGNKNIILIFGLVALQIAAVVNVNTQFYDTEYFYREYMQVLEGAVTEEKLQYIEQERLRIDTLLLEQEHLDTLFADGEISQQDYEGKLSKIQYQLRPKQAFEMVLERLEYIERYKETGIILPFVYEKGYDKLFATGDTGYVLDYIHGMVLTLLLSLTLASMYAQEHNMKPLIRYQRKGYQKMHIAKYSISALYGIFVLLLLYIPDIYIIARDYGMHNLQAPAISIPALESVAGTKCSILQYMLVVFAIRVAMVVLLSVFIAFLSGVMHNTVYTMIFSILFFCVPIILELVQIHIFDQYVVTSFLSGNKVLQLGR